MWFPGHRGGRIGDIREAMAWIYLAWGGKAHSFNPSTWDLYNESLAIFRAGFPSVINAT